MTSRSSGRRLAQAVAGSLGVSYDPTFTERVLEAYTTFDRDDGPHEPVEPFTPEDVAHMPRGTIDPMDSWVRRHKREP